MSFNEEKGCIFDLILLKTTNLDQDETETRLNETRLKSKVFSLEILILLIWTNVPRTNVAWTNVVMTGGIRCICSQDPLFKV